MRVPVEIRREQSGLNIQWQDGTSCYLSSQKLRENCPCAECREKRGDDSHQSPLLPKKKSLLRVVEASKEEALQLNKIWQVGNYALGLAWGDGHDSGIYSFDLLDRLGASQAAAVLK